VHYKFHVDISVKSPEFVVAISVFPLHTGVRYTPSILYTGYKPVKEYVIQGGFVECTIKLKT